MLPLLPCHPIPPCFLPSFSCTTGSCWNGLRETSWNIPWPSLHGMEHQWLTLLLHMVPPNGNGICLLYLALVVDCSTTLNHQLESPCFSLPHCKHLSDNAELLWGFASHHVMQILKARYKLRVTALIVNWPTGYHYIQGYPLEQFTFHGGVNTTSECHHAVTQLFIPTLWIIVNSGFHHALRGFVKILNLYTTCSFVVWAS